MASHCDAAAKAHDGRLADAENMNNRRRLVTGLAAGALAVPLWSCTPKEASTTRRLGVFQPGSPPEPLVEAIREGLKALGYVEGRDVVLEIRWAQGRPDRLDDLAKELVASKVDLITAFSTPLVLAALRASSTLPVVFTGVGDPVGTGVVRSLAHPGGNATGLATHFPELSAKRVEILREIVPKTSHFAMLWNDKNPSMTLSAQEIEEAASRQGLTIQAVGIHDLVDFDASFAAIQAGPSSALFTLADPFTRANRQRIVDFAARVHLPAVYEVSEFVESGGLVSYGPSLAAMHRRAAVFIDKIFKGAKPGDIPVEEPTVFELFVNLKTARTLGITIPDTVLLRADKVIE
jgi:putative ABC transport system substrate-binding protein